MGSVAHVEDAAQGQLLDGTERPEVRTSEDAATGLALVIERLAGNPSVDVAKLEKIIELQERILRHQAKEAFNVAFVALQADLPEIDEKGAIKDRAGTIRSRYARLEDIHEAIKPVLKEHGFSLRHRTEWPTDKPGIIRIVGILSHTRGHAEESAFEAQADASDFRTDIQSQGSTVSYGRRYTTIDLLNLTTRGLDNDGQNRRQEAKEAPAGYDAWFATLEGLADGGEKAWEDGWSKSQAAFQKHLADTAPKMLAALKNRARRAGK